MRQLVREVIDETLSALRAGGALRFEQVPPYTVEVPKDPKHGDWSCNVCLTLGKATGMKPPELADLLIAPALHQFLFHFRVIDGRFYFLEKLFLVGHHHSFGICNVIHSMS